MLHTPVLNNRVVPQCSGAALAGPFQILHLGLQEQIVTQQNLADTLSATLFPRLAEACPFMHQVV